MESFNFRWLLLSASFLFLLSFEILWRVEGGEKIVCAFIIKKKKKKTSFYTENLFWATQDISEKKFTLNI